jgi:tRNA(fMet)-specific endonuclease VapC
MVYLARAQSLAHQITAYGRLLSHLESYRRIPILGFDEAAATVFQRLRRSRIRIGTMDLKIASIVLSRHATLLSRNLGDFRQVPDLHVEDWTISR